MNQHAASKEWLSSCAASIQHFVEHATRLEPAELDLTTLEYVPFAYQIRLKISVDIELEDHRQAGRVSASDTLRVFRRKDDYFAAIRQESDALLLRRQNLYDVRDRVLGHSYGVLHDPIRVYHHPISFAWVQHCDHCHSDGAVCCSRCQGAGKKVCQRCNGQRQLLEPHSTFDPNAKRWRTEHIYRDCPSCYAHGYHPCFACGGFGKATCAPCKGTGSITHLTHLHCAATPEYQLIYFSDKVAGYIKDGLYKAGVHRHAALGAVSLIAEEIDESCCHVNFLYDAHVPFAVMSSPLPDAGGEEVHWTVYGTQPRILDADHVVELMLKKDLERLMYKAKMSTLLNPFVGWMSRKTVRTFMASEVHQEMLAVHRKGQSGTVLREALNRSLSMDYLHDALFSLKRITKAVHRWSLLRCIVLGTLLSYALMTCLSLLALYALSAKAGGGGMKRILLSPLQPLPALNVQEIAAAMSPIAHYSTPVIFVAATVVSISGHLWRGWRFKRRFGTHVYRWARSKGLLKSRWIINALAICMATWTLLLFCPAWVTGSGLLFGKLPVADAAVRILEWCQVVHYRS